MIELFMPFLSFLKLKAKVCTDNNVFRLHYKVTVIMLLVFTLLVSTKQFFGEPIHCMNTEKTKDAINSYCWFYGIYTLKSKLRGGHRKDMPYPGIGPEIEDDERIQHTYYQWVCFMLLGQAVMFYVPRYLWKMWEGGRLQSLVTNLGSPIISKDWTELRRSELVGYLSYTNAYSHSLYALRYAFCEVLNLVNVIGQIFLVDQFLGGSFRSYGAAVAAFAHRYYHLPGVNIEVNPMDQYFPKVTKCWFRNYGPSGTVELRDFLCVLPLNIVNEKIFVILWFWLIILAFASTVAVVFRVLVVALPPLRTLMIMGHLRYVKKSVVSRIVRRFGFGDWFVLYLLGKNMNPFVYKDLILELSKEMEGGTMTV